MLFEVLCFVKGFGDCVIVVFGNYDLYLILCVEGFGCESKDDMIVFILGVFDCDELMVWLCGLFLFYVEGEYVMVYVGLLL